MTSGTRAIGATGRKPNSATEWARKQNKRAGRRQVRHMLKTQAKAEA